MLILLVLGIVLVAIPVLGFIISGTILLYASLKDDGGDKLFPALLACIVVGLMLIGLYFGLTYFYL